MARSAFVEGADGLYAVQDPDAVLDYTLDWSDWLGDDIITASIWAVESGLTKGSEGSDTTTTTVFLSDGVVNSSYLVTNHITTAGGRQDDRSFRLKIRQR